MKSDFLPSVGEEVIYIDIFSLFKSLLHEINSKNILQWQNTYIGRGFSAELFYLTYILLNYFFFFSCLDGNFIFASSLKISQPYTNKYLRKNIYQSNWFICNKYFLFSAKVVHQQNTGGLVSHLINKNLKVLKQSKLHEYYAFHYNKLLLYHTIHMSHNNFNILFYFLCCLKHSY